ncbi:MAG: acylphosphatase [Actinomycetota bacterium]
MAGTRSARRIIVHGMVQGVGFRWTCARVADELGVAGWAVNLDDGTVEVLAEGDAEAVERMVDWCRRGPRHARVTRVEVGETAPRDLGTFSVA